MADELPALTHHQEVVDRVLVDARELLCRPAVWSRGAGARDGRGKDVPAGDPSAEQWSIDGALWRVAPTVADAVLAASCVRQALHLPLDNPTALWAWGDAPGRTLDGIRLALKAARAEVRHIVQGRELSVTRAIHHPVPVPQR